MSFRTAGRTLFKVAMPGSSGAASVSLLQNSSLMRIDIYTKSEELPWLVDGSVLHSAMMFRALESSRGSKPYMLVAVGDDGAEVGHLLIIKRRNFRLLPPVLSYWYTINGEGVYSPSCASREELFAAFIEKVFDMFDFRHNYIEVVNIEDSRFAYSILRKHDFIPMRDQRMYISLHSREPQERLTRAYRAHIRKAEAAGVTYSRAASEHEIGEGLSLLRNYYISKTRRRLPGREALYAMLHNADGTLSSRAKLFVVKYKEKIIGSSFCLYDKNRANLAYSCGLRKRFPMQYPGIMAIWAALTDAHKLGYAHFEFLEARALSRLHRGFTNTLLNYGGKQVGTLRWYHFRWNLVNKILRSIYV